MQDLDAETPALDGLLNARLSVMMFLQYAIWGAWLPILFPFLLGHRGFAIEQVGTIMAVGAIGAIVGPFIAGQIADRYFSTERFLALSHLAGAALIWYLAKTESYDTFLWLSLLYGLVYSPTLALTNSLAFHHLPDRDRDFGKVRVWGTFGWIAVGITVGQILAFLHTPTGVDEAAIAAAQNAGRADAFLISAGLGVVMGLYCLTLPHTPPAKNASQANATLEALGEVRRQPLLTLFLLAVPISCIHQFYFVFTSNFLTDYQAKLLAQGSDAGGFVEHFNHLVERVFGVGGGGLMTIGQMSEIVVLAFIPLFAKKLSRKSFLVIGTLAYAGRMALFAHYEAVPLPSTVTLILGVALHGLCFGCWIFVAFMIVDEETTGDVRASAQNLFNLVIIGIGIIVGSKVATEVGAWATEEGVLNYTKLFGVPMYAALAVLLLLLLFYPGSRTRSS